MESCVLEACLYPDIIIVREYFSCQFIYEEVQTAMRKNVNITEGIFPMPVLMVATYNEDGSVNVMNAAWGLS